MSRLSLHTVPRFLVKVCGMREADNIAAIAALQPDMMGLIFAPISRRYVDDRLAPAALLEAVGRWGSPHPIQKIGVFVNQETEEVAARVEAFQLDGVQLHGEESPSDCAMLRERCPGVTVSKAFGVGPGFALEGLQAYSQVCDYFVLDTKTPGHGGSGRSFDRSLLDGYPDVCEVPFLLAGGLGPDNIEAVLEWADDCEIPQLMGFDINSKVEEAPGRKSVDAVSAVIQQIRGERSKV